ncbi:hypothetical protein [Brucella sp. JSBI001]|jgi:hypothetical protein|uniref:hypothetical protein n=1 Tax=Brucella sp. JSBI001 TaxID=2886044 RepID=UPI0022317DB7|nr:MULTISPECIES: hypothetical protein [Brucella]UZD67915.1 hypothetical protein LJ361_12000 [Brucella sp. JSBI001]
MKGPKKDGDHADRFMDCQEALADGLFGLIDNAQEAGWDRIEIARAIASMAKGAQMGEMGTDPEE